MRWSFAALWMSLVALTMMAMDAAAEGTLVLLAVVGLVPPTVLLALWKTPSLAVADPTRHGRATLHVAVERRR